MASREETLSYSDDIQAYEAFLAHPGGENVPVVLVCHAWAGLSDYERDAARRVADMGYAGLCVDVYGAGKRGSTVEENTALMSPLVGDRAELQSRLNNAIEFARALPGTDPSRTAAIGFCFGGLCVLDMARMGADLKGVVSFHGIFRPAENLNDPRISAKVLALHGWEDPMAQPDDVLAFAKEMTDAGADWQLMAYGATKHAFTNPEANAPDMGLMHHPVNTERSFREAHAFLDECFS